jgi:hypothetical protein
MPTPRKYASNAEKHRAYRERQKAARLQELQAKGLPPLPLIATMPGAARWTALQETARRALETMREEMQSYYDERSESWQESDKGEEMQRRIDALDSLLSELDDI